MRTSRVRIFDLATLRFRTSETAADLVTVDVHSHSGLVLGTAVGSREAVENLTLVEEALHTALQVAWVEAGDGELVRVGFYNPHTACVEIDERDAQGFRTVFRFDDPIPVAAEGEVAAIVGDHLVTTSGHVGTVRPPTFYNIVQEVSATNSRARRF